MMTTVGIFHADFSQPAAGFRAGMIALSTAPDVVPAVLPALGACRAAVSALTQPQCHDSLLKALLAQGWQDVNYLFENGAWWELTDVLGTRGQLLAPAVDEPEEVEVTEPEPATEKQTTTIYNITKSHHFDNDRDALRLAANRATLEEASVLVDYVIKEVKSRDDAEKGKSR